MNEEQLQYDMFDAKTGRVKCQICGKPFLVISPRHLSAKHNIKYEEYVKRYPTAPLSTKEFRAKTKYSKVKDIFAPKETDDEFEEVVVEEKTTIIEEVDIEKILRHKSQLDPVKQSKSLILDTLRSYFTNIRSNYLIEEYSKMNGRILCHYITDFADPVLKIAIQFPKTFWHNRDIQNDPLKYERLRELGWKVIIINGKAPSRKDIQKILDEN